MKDNFSAIASGYASCRPGYPEALFVFLAALNTQHERALDCGTGNGQAASLLARHYQQVFATDISAAQLQHAIKMPNIQYSVSTAEQTNFPDHYFDIICAAQAAHWFDHPVFYKEVERIIKSGGILALIGYGLISIEKEIDEQIMYLYKNILGDHWDKERKYIDEQYRTLPFPYQEIALPHIEIQYDWNFNQLIGYLHTWSALGHYKKLNQSDPIEQLQPALQKAWGNEAQLRTVRFPILSRIARIG